MDKNELTRDMANDGFNHLGKKPPESVSFQNELTGSKVISMPGDGFTVRGDLTAKYYYPDGTTYEKMLGRNIVTDSGLNNICRAIASGYPGNFRVDLFCIGDAQVTESPSVTDLGHQVYSIAPTVTYTPTGQIVFTISLGDSTSGTPWPPSGSASFNEAGLKSSASTDIQLDTYKAFTSVTKDTTFRLDLSWTLTFARAS